MHKHIYVCNASDQEALFGRNTAKREPTVGKTIDIVSLLHIVIILILGPAAAVCRRGVAAVEREREREQKMTSQRSRPSRERARGLVTTP